MPNKNSPKVLLGNQDSAPGCFFKNVKAFPHANSDELEHSERRADPRAIAGHATASSSTVPARWPTLTDDSPSKSSDTNSAKSKGDGRFISSLKASDKSTANTQLAFPRSAQHSQSYKWISQPRKDEDDWERTKKQFGYMKLTSPFIPTDFRSYLIHKIDYTQAKRDRQKRKIEILQEHEEKKFPKIKLPSMNGRISQESRSAVLSESTCFCPLAWRTEEDREKEAQWPSVAEAKWDGDDRLANNAFERFLPVPRSQAYDWRLGIPVGGGRGGRDGQPIWDGVGQVPWQERKFIKPPVFDSFWGSVEWLPDEEMIFDRAEEVKECEEAGLIGFDLTKAIEATQRY